MYFCQCAVAERNHLCDGSQVAVELKRKELQAAATWNRLEAAGTIEELEALKADPVVKGMHHPRLFAFLNFRLCR